MAASAGSHHTGTTPVRVKDAGNARRLRQTLPWHNVLLAAAMLWPLAAAAQSASTSPTLSASSDGTATDMASPVGVWRTFDDHTHEPTALIQIERDPSGMLSGKVLTGLGADINPAKRCTACTDERKGQPMRGLNIMRHFEKHEDVWDNGEILDPENGKSYHCRIHLEDHGNKLVVRGYLGVPLIGRSQTWVREPHPAQALAAQDALERQHTTQ